MSSAPNVIVFLADDLGYGDVGMHGNAVVRTPHLDAFAREAPPPVTYFPRPLLIVIDGPAERLPQWPGLTDLKQFKIQAV